MTIREPVAGTLVSLAPLSVRDAPRWAAWLNDPDTTRYLFTPGRRPARAFTLEEELDWGRRALVDTRRVLFAIVDRESGEVIGHARLTRERRSGATFGIVIGEAAHRGRGRGREATALVCRYGFERMGLREIRLEVDPRNEPAIRAYRAVGFEPAGRMHMRLTQPALQAAA